jgi:hypothetical protein
MKIESPFGYSDRTGYLQIADRLKDVITRGSRPWRSRTLSLDRTVSWEFGGSDE